MTLEEIDNVEDFVGKLEDIEPPGQLVSFLTDPLLQKFVDLNPSPIVLRRIDLWLSACLEEEFDALTSGAEPSTYLEELLHGVYRHTEYTNVSRSTFRNHAWLTYRGPFACNLNVSQSIHPQLGWCDSI